SMVSDSSGLNNNGTTVKGGTGTAPVNPTPTWVAGHNGGHALALNGIDDWVNIPSSNSINSTGNTNNVAMSAWVKYTSFDATSTHWNWAISRGEAGTSYERFGLG